MELTCETASHSETQALGQQLGALLFPGAVVAIIGPMGAGKTTFTQAIAEGLGANPRQVTSPTFALVHEYAGRLPVYHFDTYRLKDVAAFVNLGTAEYFAGDGVCIVEWADRVEAALPAEHLRVAIEPLDENRRQWRFAGRGVGYDEVIGRLSGG
ncbi:MAG: tRNA (adenosine(37)-N6)-threonylcarbamoyltransferase complex ATPase subunit type 1 TsaE [Gemmataceae bacterium]